VGEISISIVEALPTTEPPKYTLWPSTDRLLSTVDWWKERKKESSWVKLTAFPT